MQAKNVEKKLKQTEEMYMNLQSTCGLSFSRRDALKNISGFSVSTLLSLSTPVTATISAEDLPKPPTFTNLVRAAKYIVISQPIRTVFRGRSTATAPNEYGIDFNENTDDGRRVQETLVNVQSVLRGNKLLDGQTIRIYGHRTPIELNVPCILLLRDGGQYRNLVGTSVPLFFILGDPIKTDRLAEVEKLINESR